MNITIFDYNTNPHKRRLADRLLKRYGLRRDDVSEIIINDDGVISFHVLDRDTKTWEWIRIRK